MDYVKDGQLFWSPPRRIPKPSDFNSTNSTHIDFVINCAFLYAKVFKIKDIEKNRDTIIKMISCIVIPPYEVKKDKYIESDETATEEQSKAKQQKENFQPGEFDHMISQIIELTKTVPEMVPEEFEKDVDENHHIDFITAASNLRAQQYEIELADRLKTKKIAGKIIPAMATTTAAVAGLVTIELIKVMIGLKNIELYKNAWMNLALPLVMLSEPQVCPITKVKEGLLITLWTKRWEIRKGNLTLGQLIFHFKKEYSLDVTGVFYGVNVVYADIYKEHKQRLPKRLTKLLGIPDNTPFVDLDCSFVKVDTKEEVTGPPVRVFL
jgi:ubiquitin-activating enzyme E1-like protein 2